VCRWGGERYPDERGLEPIVSRADRAPYVAKQDGRNTSCIEY
jgi:hypothetical protein